MKESTSPAVLVVDDERPLVEMVCDALEDAGITALPCTRSQEAFAMVQQHGPAVVILDVQMPEVDGLKVFRRMRADPASRMTPVIFVTANADKLRRWIPDYQGLSAELLPKPFELDRLLDLVRQFLARPQPRGDQQQLSAL